MIRKDVAMSDLLTFSFPQFLRPSFRPEPRLLRIIDPHHEPLDMSYSVDPLRLGGNHVDYKDVHCVT